MPRWKPGSLRPVFSKAFRPTTARAAAALSDPAIFWSVFGTYEDEPISFDRWQLTWLRDHARLRATEKAPQIGWSWLCALEALHDCLLHLDATAGFVSVDQREAQEKILYAKKAYSELPDEIHDFVPLVKDSSDELWFGDDARPSRLMSIPATSALRGRRMSVYADEADFYRDGGREVKRVALGRITRGGRFSMGSTCFGVDTELDKTMRSGVNFSRHRFPHTVVENPEVVEAVALAKAELDADDFAEEYELKRGGASSTDFPPELIRKRTHDTPLFDLNSVDPKADGVIGYDVASGSGRHPAIASGLFRIGDVHKQLLLAEIRDETLPEQEEMLHKLLDRCRHATLVVDAAGVGRQAAQSLEARWKDRVILMIAGSKPEDLEPQDKVQMVVALKRALESDEIQLAPSSEQAKQFRLTKIARTIGGNRTIEQPGTKKRSHYDHFWATCYAAYGLRQGGRESRYERGALRSVSMGAPAPRPLGDEPKEGARLGPCPSCGFVTRSFGPREKCVLCSTPKVKRKAAVS